MLIYQLLENARVSAKKDAYYHNPEEFGSDYAYGVLLLTNEIVLNKQSEIAHGADLLPHPTFGDCEWCRSEREIRLSKLLLHIKQLNQDIENNSRVYVKLKCEKAEKDIKFINSCYAKAREAIEKVYDVYKCVKKAESEMIDGQIYIAKKDWNKIIRELDALELQVGYIENDFDKGINEIGRYIERLIDKIAYDDGDDNLLEIEQTEE